MGKFKFNPENFEEVMKNLEISLYGLVDVMTTMLVNEVNNIYHSLPKWGVVGVGIYLIGDFISKYFTGEGLSERFLYKTRELYNYVKDKL